MSKTDGRHTRREFSGAAILACAGPPRADRQATDALGDLDAVGLALAIRAGTITPISAVEAAIARAERANRALNFIATQSFARAKVEAERPAQGPFAGIPTLIKDLAPTAGVRTMFGSRAFRDFVPQGNPPFVEAVFAAGFISIAKSTTPEFGLSAATEPVVTGVTRNPWGLDHSSGGSSGGAAAAVAAGVVPIAHGTDAGGSIRIPAACCGLVGLKPSRRRLVRSWEEVEPHSIAVDGCVSRTVRDTASWLAILDRRGPLYAPLDLATGPNSRRLRIGVAMNAPSGAAPKPEVARVITDTADLCRRLGHAVREKDAPTIPAGYETALTIYFGFVASMLKSAAVHHAAGFAERDVIEPLTLDLAGRFETVPQGALENAITTLREAEAIYDAYFVDLDVLLTPTMPDVAPRVGDLDPTRPGAFNRVLEQIVYTSLQNVAGAPAVSLPLFRGESGLPVGSQFSARKGQETLLLELAFELEAARPWANCRPPLWVGA